MVETGQAECLQVIAQGTGFANISTSRAKNDGLVLKDAYITAAVHCAPPGNKPTHDEIQRCSQYLSAEMKILREVKLIIVLGRIAFDAYCKEARLKGLTFAHGARYSVVGSDKILLASYHPSRQNTNTGRLTWEMWIRVFKTAREILES